MRMRLSIGAVIALSLAAACSSGPYSALSTRFGSKAPFSGTPIASSTIVLIGPQYDGATNYRGTMSVSIARGAVEIKGRGVTSFMFTPLLIPRAEVRFCGKTCFGPSNWDAEIVLESPAVKIMFHNAQEIIDWCWDERVPILPTAADTSWLYQNGRLPDPSTMESQFSTRATFDHAVRQSCLGM
jgi:hypothetical protein